MFSFTSSSKRYSTEPISAIGHRIEYSKRTKQERKRADHARKGSILVIVCMAIPMMIACCALAVDYGILNVDANRLQRACDAAALAGATKLKKTNDAADVELARTEAIAVAARNGVTLLPTDVTFPEDTVAPIEWSANSRIRVQGRFTRQLLFMRFWEQWNSSTLNRRATAQVTAVTGTTSIVPVVITTTDYNTHFTGAPLTVALIRMQSRTDFAAGRFIGISTPGNTDNIPDTTPIPTPTPTPASNGRRNGNGNGGNGNGGNGNNNGGGNDSSGNNGKSPSHWANEVQNGTTVVVNIGDNNVSINASLNNQINRISDAFTDRINDAATAGWTPDTNTETAAYPNYPGSAARRIFTIAVADPTAASTGNQNVVLLNFVKVYLVSWDATNGRAVFRLMPHSSVSSEGTYATNNVSTTGLSFVRMIDDL